VFSLSSSSLLPLSLGDEMLRAVRLVVDTNLHYYDWSPERAIEYMKENLPLEEDDIKAEV